VELSYTSQLLLSIAIFAPGLVLLAGLAFVGILMVAERLLAARAPAAPVAVDTATPVANPAAGPVVEALRASLAKPDAAADDSADQQARRAHG